MRGAALIWDQALDMVIGENEKQSHTERRGIVGQLILWALGFVLLNAITLPTPFTKVGVVTNCSTLPSEGHNHKRSPDTTNEQSIEQIIICILICIGSGQEFVSVSLHGKPLTLT